MPGVFEEPGEARVAGVECNMRGGRSWGRGMIRSIIIRSLACVFSEVGRCGRF